MIIEPIIHQCECETCKAGFDAEIKERHQRINLFLSRLNEPQRRWYVATSLCDYNDETTPRNNLECKAEEKKAWNRI